MRNRKHEAQDTSELAEKYNENKSHDDSWPTTGSWNAEKKFFFPRRKFFQLRWNKQEDFSYMAKPVIYFSQKG